MVWEAWVAPEAAEATATEAATGLTVARGARVSGAKAASAEISAVRARGQVRVQGTGVAAAPPGRPVVPGTGPRQKQVAVARSAACPTDWRG